MSYNRFSVPPPNGTTPEPASMVKRAIFVISEGIATSFKDMESRPQYQAAKNSLYRQQREALLTGIVRGVMKLDPATRLKIASFLDESGTQLRRASSDIATRGFGEPNA